MMRLLRGTVLTTVANSSIALYRDIYWIGGSPCAGKTSVATILGARFGWSVYHCDDWFERHRLRATVEVQPTFHALSRLSGDALWLRPVADQIESEIPFCAEEFALVLEDLRDLVPATSQPLLFEGTAALPHLLHPLLAHPSRAVWLIPTVAFQRQHYRQRPWVQGVLASTSDPAVAFDNWMARDAGFARWLEAQATQYHLPWFSVDGSISLDAMADLVATHFHAS